MVLPVDVASGGTTLARVFAKHLAETIPGHPNVIVKNMAGAAYLKATYYMLKSAAKDGTVIYYGPRKPIGVLLHAPGHNFKYTDFTILGGMQLGGLVVYARNDITNPPATSVMDFPKAKDLKFGGVSADHTRVLLAGLSYDLLGLKWRAVLGYKSSGQSRAALLKGEINTMMDQAHPYRNQVVPQLIDTHKGFPAYQIPVLEADGTITKNPLFPHIPSFMTVYAKMKGGKPSGPTWDALKFIINIEQTMPHVFLGPPNMNKQAAKIVREAIMKGLTSDDFRKDAQKILTFVPHPLSYERAESIMVAEKNLSPEIEKRIATFVKVNSHQ